MLLFHYVLCFARRAIILLYMRVLLSTRAVNEQLKETRAREREKEREKERIEEKKKRKSFFLHANTATKVGLACIFWNKKGKKREKEKE
jgi:hypothetical protein